MRIVGGKKLFFLTDGFIAFFGLLNIAFLIAFASNFLINRNNNEPSRTSPISETLRLAAVGDFNANENTQAVLTKIADEKPDITLALGDLSYGVLGEAQWCDLITNTLGPTHPFQLIAGNHDVNDSESGVNQGYIDRFASCLPNRIASTVGTYGQQYYFDYENLARVIMISPDIPLNDETQSYTAASPEFAWLEAAITDARARDINWIIVGMHKNCLTVGVKTCETGTDLLDLLANQKVDLVLQGHEHGYFRTKQLTVSERCPSLQPNTYSDACIVEDVENNEYTKGLGSIVTIAGTGGQELRGVDTTRPDAPYFAYYSGANEDPAYGPMIIDLSELELSAYFAGTDGINRDAFSIIGD